MNSISALSKAAQAELANGLYDVWNQTGHDLDMLHDAVNMMAPGIARKYGEFAGSIAADLWEQIYQHDTGRYAEAAVYGDDDLEHLFGASSGYAFSNDQMDVDAKVAHVLATMGRGVRGYSRKTMQRNTQRHNGRYARVPTGDTTCAFCLMLASRGFVYKSEETAGDTGDLFNRYHDHCDCEVIASFDTGNSLLEGYNPDEYYGMYLAARSRANSGDTNEILSSMRSMFGLK